MKFTLQKTIKRIESTVALMTPVTPFCVKNQSLKMLGCSQVIRKMYEQLAEIRFLKNVIFSKLQKTVSSKFYTMIPKPFFRVLRKFQLSSMYLLSCLTKRPL